MSISKAEKEKLQLIQEKSQQILSELLKDEDNKYCVDCDAKGPRWASWNLGVFLCIRCAGIHRNLGVHISKVKSVNLDSWSPEQVAYMQLMGNSKARAVYEANLPDNFKRPQVDSSLEAFVRSKYEHKKYLAKEWVQPPTPKPAFDIEEERKKDKEKKRNKITKVQTNSTIVEVQTNPVPRPHSSPAGTAISADKIPISINKNTSNGVNKNVLPSTDLLGLNTGLTTKSNGSDDDFDAFVSYTPVNKAADDLVNIGLPETKSSVKTNEEEDFFNQKATEPKKLDKESILKLYESNSNQGLFNLTSSSAPLQPMNITATNSLINGFNGYNTPGGLLSNSLLNSNTPSLATNTFNSPTSQSTNVMNGFVNFPNHQPANLNQQPFLAFNQQTPSPVQQSAINHNTNPFLTSSTTIPNPIVASATNLTNGTILASGDLFSSNVNSNLSTTLEQLNGLNLNTASNSIVDWPSNGNAAITSNISIGQSLFSANFNCLNDKKPNEIVPSTVPTLPVTNPFLNHNNSAPSISNSNLEILSPFNVTNSTTSITNGLGLTNSLNNDSEGWSSFHTAAAPTTANTGLTADIWP